MESEFEALPLRVTCIFLFFLPCYTFNMAKLITIVKFILGMFFIIGGVSKIISPESFISAVRFFLSDSLLANTVLILLPITEIFIGIDLTLRKYAMLDFFVITIGVLSITIIVYLNSPPSNLACGCLGNFIHERFDTPYYIKNIFVFLISYFLFIYEIKNTSPRFKSMKNLPGGYYDNKTKHAAVE